MDVQQFRRRVRQSSPLGQPGTRAVASGHGTDAEKKEWDDSQSPARYRQSSSEPIDGLQIESVNINPATVLPGGTVTVTVVLRETAEAVLPGDPDLCAPEGSPVGSGLLGEVTVNPGWGASDSERACVPVFAVLGPGRKEIQFQFTAPQADTETQFPVSISLRLPSSGQGPVTVNENIVVAGSSGGGQPGCSTDDDCPSGTVCDGGQCVPDDNGGGNGGGGGGWLGDFSDIERIMLLLIVLFVTLSTATDR